MSCSECEKTRKMLLVLSNKLKDERDFTEWENYETGIAFECVLARVGRLIDESIDEVNGRRRP